MLDILSLGLSKKHPYKMIELKPLLAEHVSFFYKWIADEEVIRYSLSGFQKMKTTAHIDAWYDVLLEDGATYQKGIFLKGTDQLIGYAGICDISESNRSGEYFIFVGDKQEWGKGIGTEVSKQILQVGFEELNLNRIMLTVSEPNAGGVKAYEKAGFKLEGRMHEACYRDGAFHDKLIMSVLKREWL